MSTQLVSIPIDQRASAAAWAAAFDQLAKPWCSAYEVLARRWGVSVSTVRRKHEDYRAQGIAGLVDARRSPGSRAGITEEFVTYWKTLTERNQRSSKAAYRVFLADWSAGREIPGIDGDQDRTRPPEGCSYENLMRMLDKWGLLVARRGLATAMVLRGPQTLSTREGGWVMRHLMIDDQWHDNFVVDRGDIVRVLEMGALDYFSAKRVAWGTKTRTLREDGKWDHLKESATRMLLAHVLHNIGYSPRGTEIVAEHGTAAVPEYVKRILHDYQLSDLITVRESGIVGKEQALAHQAGVGKGNFRFKASLESQHNLIRNELAALPGQTGLSPERRPEQTHGVLQEAEIVLKVARQLARSHPERLEWLMLPLLEYRSQFEPLLAQVYRVINDRTEHELEGWERCGHMQIQYRLSPTAEQWLGPGEFLALPEASRQMLQQVVVEDSRYFRLQRMSPAAVFARADRELLRIPDYLVAEILGRDLAREQACDEFCFEFEDVAVAPEAVRYRSLIVDAQGREQVLRPDKYMVFVNPFCPSALFVHDAKGVYLGKAERVVRASRGDYDATVEQWRRNAHQLKVVTDPYRARHTQEVREASIRAKRNALVADTTRPLTGTERVQARAQDGAARLAERALEAMENPYEE